jgi:WD40 repeat protein
VGKFIAAFHKPISESAPHIYLSALPFSPSLSKVSKQYLSKFPRTLALVQGKESHWPAVLNTFHGHNDVVTSVAFSPDGKHIASGSRTRQSEYGMLTLVKLCLDLSQAMIIGSPLLHSHLMESTLHLALGQDNQSMGC